MFEHVFERRQNICQTPNLNFFRIQRSQEDNASDGCRDACQTDMNNNNHLLWRAGFGPACEQLSVLRKASHLQVYDALEKASRKEPIPIEVAENFMKGFSIGIGEAGKMQMRDLSDEQKKNLRKQSREGIRSLNLRWLGEMVNSNAQLREKMAFFWHGHFACRKLNVSGTTGTVHFRTWGIFGN